MAKQTTTIADGIDRRWPRRIQRALPVLAGLALIGAAFALNALLGGSSALRAPGAALVLAGCVLAGLGLTARAAPRRAALARISLPLLSMVLALGLSEMACGWIGFDFAPPDPRIPIFNRPPDVHLGGGILRRPGPAVWRGRPLCSLIEACWGNRNAYPDERAIEVRYDRHGFRNPADLQDWDVVVAGDSFVESGHLPFEEIFTTLAAQRLGIRIKNLGVSGTGPVFQTAYLTHFGKAPSTKHAVLCFFDGNDVSDLIREVQETNFIARAGHRLGREKQTSLLMALHERWQRLTEPCPSHAPRRLAPNAVLTAGGRDYPAAIWPIAPPCWEDLAAEHRALVSAALGRWGDTVKALGMQPWVLCIPDSRRVFHGRLRHTDPDSPMARWQPGLFGPPLAALCADLHIGFIDAFPALRGEMDAGRIPYNFFGDVHLNAHGSRIVAGVLAEALSTETRLNSRGASPVRATSNLF